MEALHEAVERLSLRAGLADRLTNGRSMRTGRPMQRCWKGQAKEKSDWLALRQTPTEYSSNRSLRQGNGEAEWRIRFSGDELEEVAIQVGTSETFLAVYDNKRQREPFSSAACPLPGPFGP